MSTHRMYYLSSVCVCDFRKARVNVIIVKRLLLELSLSRSSFYLIGVGLPGHRSTQGEPACAFVAVKVLRVGLWLI